jgi:hypothetical protein
MHWPAGRRLAASCRRHGRHRAPDEQCSCGIYAVMSSDALGTVRTGVSVVGSVALWGRVVEGPNGFRGERAYPLRLYVPDGLAAELDAYGVTIVRERVRPAA